MKSVLPTLLLCLLGAQLAAAPYSERGLKSYVKLCKKCHGGPFKGAAMKTSDEWKAFFKDDANILSAHKGNEKATGKITSSGYEKRKEDIALFLSNNAKDMGPVPGCDANYCGH